MTLQLTVQRETWRAHVHGVAASYADGLWPVVKGNGYGFGRGFLHGLVDELCTPAAPVCVGTVHELGDAPHARPVVVLMPAAASTLARATVAPNVVLSVASVADCDALPTEHTATHAPVAVKLRSSMNRLGASAEELGAVLDRVTRRARAVHSLLLHLPRAGDDEAHAAEVRAWAARLDDHGVDPGIPLSVSHLGAQAFTALRDALDRPLSCRVGSALWHGAKGPLHLGADVLAVHPVRGGQRAGYQLTEVPADGHLVVVGAGTANGVVPLPDGRSSLHFGRRRLTVLELPHMHSTICFVPHGEPLPEVGSSVDVQRPLIGVHPDVISWE